MACIESSADATVIKAGREPTATWVGDPVLGALLADADVLQEPAGAYAEGATPLLQIPREVQLLCTPPGCTLVQKVFACTA